MSESEREPENYIMIQDKHVILSPSVEQRTQNREMRGYGTTERECSKEEERKRGHLEIHARKLDSGREGAWMWNNERAAGAH